MFAWEVISKSLRLWCFFGILVCTCGQERVKLSCVFIKSRTTEHCLSLSEMTIDVRGSSADILCEKSMTLNFFKV